MIGEASPPVPHAPVLGSIFLTYNESNFLWGEVQQSFAAAHTSALACSVKGQAVFEQFAKLFFGVFEPSHLTDRGIFRWADFLGFGSRF